MSKNTIDPNSTILNMRYFDVDGAKVLRQLRRFSNGETKWEDVGSEETEDKPSFTERFKDTDFAPHSIVSETKDNTEAIVRHIKRAKMDIPDNPTPVEITESLARGMRFEAMFIRIAGGDIAHAKKNGVYFNGNQMGLDIFRLFLEAAGEPWSSVVQHLHLGKRHES